LFQLLRGIHVECRGTDDASGAGGAAADDPPRQAAAPSRCDPSRQAAAPGRRAGGHLPLSKISGVLSG